MDPTGFEKTNLVIHAGMNPCPWYCIMAELRLNSASVWINGVAMGVPECTCAIQRGSWNTQNSDAE